MSRVPLSLRFLIASAAVGVFATIISVSWTGRYVQSSIAEGIAVTVASGIDALVEDELFDLADGGGQLSADAKAAFDAAFERGNNRESTRMLQMRVWQLDGSPLYEAGQGLADPMDAADFRIAAEGGKVVSSIEKIALEPVGPIAALPLSALRVYTPLHDPTSGQVIAVAALYYSAGSLLGIHSGTQRNVWIISVLMGGSVIFVLSLIVDRSSRAIAAQRARLARNLVASRRLAQEVHALHAESERLRHQANASNESLLHQVGSDIHDGPLQLLTLIILRLSKAAKEPGTPPAKAAERATTLQLASEAMEELRNISTGLVLPELEPLDLAETIELAVSRHEEATGMPVGRQLGALPEQASMAVKICAYRIIQEALNNAFRHTKTPYSMVAAEARNGRLAVTISNPAKPGGNGGEEAPAHEGLGMRGMRFRVESLGGKLSADIGSSPVSSVSAEIPITAGEQAGRRGYSDEDDRVL